MSRFEEMTPRGRRVKGPISDLVELDANGARAHAIAFHDDYRTDPALVAGLDGIRDFLELPMVDGICPLGSARNGAFAYATGEVRTVRELVGVFAEDGG